MQERTALEDQLTSIERIERELDDQLTMIELGEAESDTKTITEAENALKRLKLDVARRELEALLSGEADGFDTFLEVHAGAGGTESQDWANMLMRMYTRWAEQHGLKVEWIEETGGEEAGIKSATVQIKGRNAYGWLKTENGVHRLVRISPFELEREAAYLVRERQRLSGDRRPHQGRHQGIRRAHRYAARQRRGRPARQQDRVGDPTHAHPDQHRGVLPERPLAAP